MGPVRTLTDSCRVACQATKPFPTRTLPCKLKKENAMADPSSCFLAFLLGTVPKILALQIWVFLKTRAPTEDNPKSSPSTELQTVRGTSLAQG